jgi:hypothetical protein
MMIKEPKYFRKQAEKAEQMALATPDEEASQSLSDLAQAYRSQAGALKISKKEKLKKKKPKSKKLKHKAEDGLKIKKSKKGSRLQK